jgi:YD repeat-containing protein
LESEVDSYNAQGSLLQKQTKYYFVAGADPSLAVVSDPNPDFPNLLYRQDTTLDDGRMSRDCWQYDEVAMDCTQNSGLLTTTAVPANFPLFTYSTFSDQQLGYLLVPSPWAQALFYGNKTRETHYDYGTSGSGVPGPVLSDTQTTYLWSSSPAYETAGLLKLPSTVVVNNGSGQRMAETDYYYDENNGSPQGVYGNLTSVKRWLNATNSWVTTSTIYDNHGMPICKVDGRGNSTKIVYDGTGLYPQSITSGIPNSSCSGSGLLTTTYQYDSSTGSLLSTTDPNNVTTNYSYNDPLGRVTNIKKAVGTSSEAWTKYTYNSPTSTTVNTDLTTKGDGLLSATTITDGFGRVIQTTDPTGANVQKIYDSRGNLQAVSNPYTGTTPSIYTSYLYDGLGRMVDECHQDNGSGSATCVPGNDYLSWSYTGSCTTAYDEVGNPSTRCSDALGRLLKVGEPGNLTTTYSYDALSNLQCVDQWGTTTPGATPCTSGRKRQFSYDSLSRLVTSFNPETGTICYGQGNASNCANGYDGNGNLLYKTDNRGITVGYSYDVLNRLYAKSYINDPLGTASSCYQYDSTAVPGAAANYFLGRLTNSWTQKAGCTAPSQPALNSSATFTRRSVLAYSPLGQVLSEQQCTKSNCATGAPYNPIYDYNSAGNLVHHSNGIGTLTFTNCYNGSGQLSLVVSVNIPCTTNPSYPAVAQLFSSPSYTTAGALSGATYGSGLVLSRSYDSRLRIAGEMDTGNSVTNPTPGTAKITITGTDQTH